MENDDENAAAVAEEWHRQNRKSRNCGKKAATFLFSHVGLAAMVVGYTVMGGFLFQALEAPHENRVKMRIKWYKEDRIMDILQLAVHLNIQNLDAIGFAEKIRRILLDFQETVTVEIKTNGWNGKDDTDESAIQWSFAGSLLYAVTVITTIGYGHVAPKTVAGRLVTILYAMVGIPLTFLYLSNMGNFTAECFRLFYKKICCGICIYCRLSRYRTKLEKEKEKRMERRAVIHQNLAFENETEMEMKESEGRGVENTGKGEASFSVLPNGESKMETNRRSPFQTEGMGRTIITEGMHGGGPGSPDSSGSPLFDSISNSRKFNLLPSPVIASSIPVQIENETSVAVQIENVSSIPVSSEHAACIPTSPIVRRDPDRPTSCDKSTEVSEESFLEIDEIFKSSDGLEQRSISSSSASLSAGLRGNPSRRHFPDGRRPTTIFERTNPRGDSTENTDLLHFYSTSGRRESSAFDDVTRPSRYSRRKSTVLDLDFAPSKHYSTRKKSTSDLNFVDSERYLPNTVINFRNDDDDDEGEMGDVKMTVPISICLIIIAVYIFAGSMLFALWEDWDYLTGSYFCFITLSTIGFGDIVPGTDMKEKSAHTKLLLCSLWLVVGLSLLAMCFNLMQEEVREKCRWLGLKLGILKE